MDAKILIVDDKELVREFFLAALTKRGYAVQAAVDGQAAAEMLDTEPFDLIISDVLMPRMGGMELLRHVLGHHPLVPVVMLTAFASVENAVEAMRTGAFDYIAKPVTDLAQLDIVLSRALGHRRLLVENQRLRQGLDWSGNSYPMVGPGPAMQRVFDHIARAAPTQATVLVTGASGTGKELVARALHNGSPRASGPFIQLNCAAVPEGLIESELFGHEKGSFTGAVKTTRGRFEAAHGGTLLLDEIGDMPLPLQAKLLRALQERQIERVGSTDPVSVDVRVVATTHRDLEKDVAAGRFRQDLFYRLNVLRIKMPSLAERPGDIPILTYHFLRRFARLHGRPVERISEQGMRYLLNSHWPGNVRELENAVERAVVMCRTEQVELTDFFMDESPPESEAALSRLVENSLPPIEQTPTGGSFTLAEIERRHILATLAAHNGHRLRTAEALGISIRTLRNKLNEYKMGGDEA